MGKIIGIDLGTTNSEVAVMEAGKPQVIKSSEGNPYFPSVVAFTKDGEKLVGEPAKRQAVVNPEGTIMRIKRQMGTSKKVKVHGKEYSPEQISAFVLQKIKTDAEDFLGEKITDAVITVPAYFDDDQRQATKTAGEIAGFTVRRIINEPTAAALSFGLEQKGEHKIAVYDLGGGTFDITLMEVGDGVFEVLATNGDTHLGGSDMDQVLVDYMATEFQKKHKVDLRTDVKSMQRLVEAAENAKIELSSTLKTTVNLPYVTATDTGPLHLEMEITRAQLDKLVEPIIAKTIQPCKQALKDAKLNSSDIDHIVLVGGPTRMPIVQKQVTEIFGKKAERGVDPMECVAVGAAIQAGVLSGDIEKDIVLLDVTPLTLSIETLGGISTSLIDRNTTIPTKKSKIFSTAADNQTSVEINVLQGERPMATDNKSLGRFHLDGILPAPRGVPQIEVTFDIDVNGILNVSAKDLGTGKEQSIRITGSTKLSDTDIEKAKQEAKQHAEEDQKRKEKIEIRNNADTLVNSTEKTLEELKDQLSSEDKEKLEEAVTQLKEALTGDDMETIKTKSDELSKLLQQISTTIYQQAAKQQQAQTSSDESTESQKTWKGHPSDSDTVDTDYEVKDDK
jgi:molecular chaperone DnaK